MGSSAGRRTSFYHPFILTLGALALSACTDGQGLSLSGIMAKRDLPQEEVSRAQVGIERVEREIEAPDVFSANEAGLWDGRPSLGGIWVAHPEVESPERVIIRNQDNDKFVVGALFRREREIPGPRLQISSDAAEALSVLAGAPANLEVVALRKEEIEIDATLPPLAENTDPAIDEAPEVEVASLEPVDVAALDPALVPDAPVPVPPVAPVATIATPAPAPSQPTLPVTQRSNLTKPYLQIGIFSVEQNAKRSADMLRNAGMIPTVKSFDRDGKPFWRVIVGPAADTSERGALLAAIRKEGFTDAYAVTN